MKVIQSRDNPRVKALRRLARGNGAYRADGEVWIEGEHLCTAALDRGWEPVQWVLARSTADQWQGRAGRGGAEVLVLDDALMAQISALESPPGVAMVLRLPGDSVPDPAAPTVVLDRLQDAGNVGSILRSAAAFGFKQVIALRGTAALWGGKVVRAGMGAHFGLRLFESMDDDALGNLQVPLVATSSHQGRRLHEAAPAMPCAWVFGHEGQGVSPAVAARADCLARIAQPGGEESLNVAAAAAICLHASATAGVPLARSGVPAA